MEIAFVKMARIFHIEIEILYCTTQMYIKKIEEKLPGKVGECIFDSWKCKSFQGP